MYAARRASMDTVDVAIPVDAKATERLEDPVRPRHWPVLKRSLEGWPIADALARPSSTTSSAFPALAAEAIE
jgi:hypothetical protein